MSQGTRPENVIWHDVECGGYEEDLPLWEKLAEEAGGPVLELGCGSGRVALHLARRGHEVAGIDLDPELLAAARERGAGLDAEFVAADARELDLGREAALVIAPMQLLQLLDGPGERSACLAAVARHLRPGARAAFAIVESMAEPDADARPLPDVRELDGWVFSSLPVDAIVGEEEIAVRRLRQTVSPAGELEESPVELRLARLSAPRLEQELMSAGMAAAGRLAVAPTAAHVGSTVVLAARGA